MATTKAAKKKKVAGSLARAAAKHSIKMRPGVLRKITLAKPDFPDHLFVRREEDTDGSVLFVGAESKKDAAYREADGTRIATYQLAEIETVTQHYGFTPAKR